MDSANPPVTVYPNPTNPMPRKYTDSTTVHVNPFGTRRLDVFFQKRDYEGLEFKLVLAKRNTLITLLTTVPQPAIYIIPSDEVAVYQMVYYGGITETVETVSDPNGLYVLRFNLYKK